MKDAARPDWAARYQCARRQTGPVLAAGASGNIADGYWVDAERYFFLDERFDPELGCQVTVPKVADCRSFSTREILPYADLCGLIRQHGGRPQDRSILYDMPRAGLLTVSVGGKDLKIDLTRNAAPSVVESLKEPALFSPDGRFACYLQASNIWLYERSTGTRRALTADGEPGRAYAQDPESALAALRYRDNPAPRGIWSPDSAWFLTHLIDERHVPTLPIIQNCPTEGGRPVLRDVRYPMAGDPVPLVTLVAVHVSGRVRILECSTAPFTAYSHIHRSWFGDPGIAWSIRVDRYHRLAELLRLELDSGSGQVVLREPIDNGYLDLHPVIVGTPNVRTLGETRNEVIWYSERDGWGHLYRYDATTGALKNQITQGHWVVRDIVDINEERGDILFLAGGIDPKKDPLQRSLCRVNLDGTGFCVMIDDAGDIYVPKTEPCGFDPVRPYRPTYAKPGVSPDGRHAVVRHSSVIEGNRTDVVNLATRTALGLAVCTPSQADIHVKKVSVLAADGATQLFGVLFLPAGFEARGSYPVIDYLYPGPQVTQQPQAFRTINSAPARALAELGFAVLMLDSRGTPGRSRAFHQAGYRELLEPQLEDHAAAVRQLCQQFGFLDASRVGVLGHSGGGAAAARALFDYGDLYTVGVAVCGNHDSSLFISTWSDKYRGPGNADDWSEQSNASAAHKLRGKLLLVSGDMDDVVHVSQTLLLVSALVKANKDFDLLIVPNEGHLLMLTSGYVQRRIWDYFVRNLAGSEPPVGEKIVFDAAEIARCEAQFAREVRE